MYEHRLYTQNAQIGEVGRILEGVTTLATGAYDEFQAAIAYASVSGCKTLFDALENTNGGWKASRKQWLISIDFGRTEPEALERLADVAGSEVRVPNGVVVSRVPRFFPPSVFHPKVYVVRDSTTVDSLPMSLFVGSANLTLSGLVLGNECGTLQRWTSPLRTAVDRQLLKQLRSGLTWFEKTWAAADPLHDVLPQYKRVWRRTRVPPSEDETEAARLYRGAPGVVTQGHEAIGLRNAKGFWVETDTLYKNRGAMRAGNQVDLPRGSRVFFGFTPAEVPRNTVFGELVLHCVGFDPARRTMRFGNNMMDKINLPIPGSSSGPATYDHSVVLFERDGKDRGGLNRFAVRIGTSGDLAKWKRTANGHVEKEMTGGRRYGLLF
jgi:hypothetical protein